jgi:hypothetical protein
MKQLQTIAFKSGLFALMLLSLNFLYGWLQFPAEVKEAFPDWDKIQQAGEADILYLGESSNVTYGDLDFDKSSIHEFLQRHFPGLQTIGITQAAAHAGHYVKILQNIPCGKSPKSVVVTLNLRSFSPQWVFAKQAPALDKKMVLLGQGPVLWRKLMLTLRQYNRNSEADQLELTQNAWKTEPLPDWGAQSPRNVHQWDSILALKIKKETNPDRKRKLVLATHYLKAYAFQIDTLSHPRIADLDALVGLCNERGWNLTLNLLPENTQKAEELFRDTLANLMRSNADWLTRRYRHKGVDVVNLLDSLPNECFLDQDWTTEHYNEFGRRKVARLVSLSLKRQYPSAWRESLQFEQGGLSRFTNDFEGGTKWSQMHTCTTQRSHSGSMSSMVGGKEPFSVTWTSGLDKLDSTKLDSVEVSFWLYQDALDHAAAIAFEASGDSVSYMWDSLSVKRFTNRTSQWVPVKVAWKTWPEFKQADLMKIYLYNPSAKAVWVDDWIIQFK